MEFRSAEENDIDSVVIGEFSTYDGSGYVQDFELFDETSSAK